MIRLTVVIPVYSGWIALQKCLEHLANSGYREFETLVINHSSEDQPPLDFGQFTETARLRVIKASPDLWWTGATNVGIRAAQETNKNGYIMLLNHDCFLDKDAMSRLIHAAVSNPDSIIAPVQLDADSRKILVDTAYTSFLFGFSTIVTPARCRFGKSRDLVRTGMIVGGRGVVIPSKIFDEVGLLDEADLPHYGSDNDFYLRCKKAGFPLLLSRLAKAYIDNSQTTEAINIGRLSIAKFLSTFSNRRSHRNIKDQMALFRKHFPIPFLYPIGVFLNLARYSIIYLLARARFLLLGR